MKKTTRSHQRREISWRNCAVTRRAAVSRRQFPGRHRPWPCHRRDGRRGAGLRPRKAYAALSGTVNFTTWPNYFAQENLDNFTKDTGVKINVAVFGSNEEMLAKLQAGSTGWDVFVPTNYTISTYKELGPDRAARSQARCRTTTRPRRNSAFTAEGIDRRQDLCRAEGLGHHGLCLSTPRT